MSFSNPRTGGEAAIMKFPMKKCLASFVLGVAVLPCAWAQAPAPAYPATSGPPSAGQPPAATQQAAASAADPSDDESALTIRKRVEEVNVIFTVTDKHGKFIKDLKQQDFKILDDRKPPEVVRDFRSETNLPLRVGLLIDASNSISMRFRFEQEAATEFLNQIVRPKSDLAFVLGFDTVAEVTADYTDNTEKLSKGIRMLRPGGGTALYDAIYYACRDKLMKAQTQGPVRRA